MLSQASLQALARLRAYTPPPTRWYDCPLTRRAAVLILLFPDRYGELKVVLTMRASTLRNYAGQVALPGGKSDTLNETPFQVARREAFEEIGLPMTDAKLPPGFKIEHLCELPANLARTELGVRPCVAFLSPSSASTSTSTSSSSSSPSAGSATIDNTNPTANSVEETMIPRLDPKEVAAVFTAPFHDFLSTQLSPNYHAPTPTPTPTSTSCKPPYKPHSWYRGTWTDWYASRWRMHNFYLPRPPPSPTTLLSKPPPPHVSSPPVASQPKGRVPEGDDPTPEPTPFSSMSTFRIFGMTARILVDAARVAYGEEPEFEHNSHFGDEELIGRLLGMGRLGERRREGENLTGEVVREASKI